MYLPDMVVFNKLLKATYMELIRDHVVAFNEASGGTLLLSAGNEAIDGDFEEESYFKQMENMIRRRNPYTQGNIDSLSFEMDKHAAVKLAGGTKLIKWTLAQFDWIKMNPAKAAVLIATNLAEQKFKDYFYQAVSILLAAMYNDAGTNMLDESGGSNTLTHARMTSARGLLGDAHESISAWITHSTPLFDLYQSNLGNTEKLFSYGDVVVRVDPFGTRIIMADIPQLIDGGDYTLMGLTPGSVKVKENNDYRDQMLPIMGQENLAAQWQAEWTYEVEVKGYGWNMATGGAAPTDAALQSSANWTRKQTTTHKLLPGVLLKVDS